LRNPVIILKNLSEKSCNGTYKFQRLYRNLYNAEFYLLAYRNICASEGNMTAGVDGKTIDGMSMGRIREIITSLQDHSYQPNPARRVYIEKKNSTKKRLLGIPSANDKLIQEVVRMILESIYEPNFSENSHGFRPKRSCHTALRQINRCFTGTKWFIEGDIKACFESFDHHVLINILRKRISDEYFIVLIWKFLKAGYMEQWEYHATYSGTPQGSGASPILANIYLNELDKYIQEYKAEFDLGKGSGRKTSKEYGRISIQYHRAKHRYAEIRPTLTDEERVQAVKELKAMQKKIRSTPRGVAIDPSFKRLVYCRYADDWLIGVNGSKRDAERIKTDIKRFLNDKLNLELSDTKTKITHSSGFARFLSYDVTVVRSQEVKRNKNGDLNRAYNGNIKLYVPKEKWIEKLREYSAFKIIKDEHNKEKWKPVHRGKLMNARDVDIISKYNSEIRALYNYPESVKKIINFTSKSPDYML